MDENTRTTLEALGLGHHENVVIDCTLEAGMEYAQSLPGNKPAHWTAEEIRTKLDQHLKILQRHDNPLIQATRKCLRCFQNEKGSSSFVHEIVCYGIGNFESWQNALFQLAYAIQLRKEMMAS